MSHQIFQPPIPQPFALYDGELANGSGGALTANGVYFVAVVLDVAMTITGVRVRFATGGNGHYDTGIYDATGANDGPGALLAHSTTTTTQATATGAQSPAFTTGNLLLKPGRYWLALWVDSASDTVVKSTGTAQMDIAQSGTVASGPLPANASSVTGLANTTVKPILIGLKSGGWS